MGKPLRHLESRTWGALPLVNAFCERLQLDGILTEYLPHTDCRQKLPPARAIGVLVLNLLISRRPLYALGEWAAPWEPALLGLGAQQLPLVNDDRLGRALDRLFDADRPSLVMAVVARAMREFDLRLEELHTDATTVTFHGQYRRADGRPVRGKPTVVITWGHNKDHRPDLKQLLYSLTVTTDGAVPVHYHVWHGNTPEDATHQATWDVVRGLVGHEAFLYVGDCKLCAEQTLRYIDGKGGRFITVLPRTRQEEQDFRQWIQTHEVPWVEVWRRPARRRQHDPPDVYLAYEWPLPSAEGFRILWMHSSEKERRDRAEREANLERARRALEDLNRRLAAPKCRLRERLRVEREVDRALGEAARWIRVEIRGVEVPRFRQETRGRPGRHTRYRREVRERFEVTWEADVEAVGREARTDGIFPLISNDRTLAAKEVLLAYKRQPAVEQRFNQLKNAYDVMPQYLKGVARIEALLCAYFLALLVGALIEREIRRAMKQTKRESLPLYPEQRECKKPTTERILETFEGIQVHRLYQGTTIEEVFGPELTRPQRQVLTLLGVPPSRYNPM
jgi:transposase